MTSPGRTSHPEKDFVMPCLFALAGLFAEAADLSVASIVGGGGVALTSAGLVGWLVKVYFPAQIEKMQNSLDSARESHLKQVNEITNASRVEMRETRHEFMTELAAMRAVNASQSTGLTALAAKIDALVNNVCPMQKTPVTVPPPPMLHS